jgi:two-component system OmpR family sensor kinase
MFPVRPTLRWRIAVLCAGLTMLILIAFAAVLGTLLTSRIEDDQAAELQRQARDLALAYRPSQAKWERPLLPADAVYRILYPFGVTKEVSSPLAHAFGSPGNEITEARGILVATASITRGTERLGFVQFGRPDDAMDATIGRVWLFLGLCVIGGTALALLAGLTVAGQAMKPITSLTELARKVARSGDPSDRAPVLTSDDEVGELARTFEGMLDSIEASETQREDAFRRQREFIADASHELRTPLTSIQLNLEMLRDGHDEDGVAVTSALDSTRRMNLLVADLLMLARTDSNTTQSLEPIDLSEITRAAVREVEPIATDHVLVSSLTDCPRIEGDQNALQRAARNLIENAVRHTPPGTEVMIRTEPYGDAIRLVVSDNGPGLPDGKEEQVFERFARADGSADTTRSEGTGLGLAIVRAVADAHGGSASARNRPGGGAEFELTIPTL